MKYFVYEHWLDNQCFYVGHGIESRPKGMSKSTRNRKWHNFCNDNFERVEIKIIEEFDNKKKAEDFEKALTIYHDHILNSPLTNIATGHSPRGALNSMTGIKKTIEHRKNMSRNHANVRGGNNPRSIKVTAEKDGSIKEFDTIYECMEFLNVSFSTLKDHLLDKHISRKIEKTGWYVRLL